MESILFPIKYYDSFLVFDKEKNECDAVFKVNGFNYDYKSNSAKIAILNALTRFLANIGKQARILIVPVSQNIDKHYKRILHGLNKDDVLYDAAEIHAEHTKRYLKQKMDNANDYKVYVITKLKLFDSIFDEIGDVIHYFIKSPMATLDEFVGVKYRDIYEKDIEQFCKMANDYFRKQENRIAISKCSSYDIQWLIRRPFFRGIGDVPIRTRKYGGKSNENEEDVWTPFYERNLRNDEEIRKVDEKRIISLTEGEIDTSEGRILKVCQDDGRISYQAFLTIAHIPDDDMLFPGNEWLLVLQDYPIETEVSINIETIEHKESVNNINKKKKEINDQIEHIDQSDDEVPEELVSSRVYANDLEAEIKAARDPILNTSITLCIFADNKETLETNVSFIKEFYEDNNFVVERPVSDQLKLFMEFFPCTGRYVNDYILPLPPKTLAGAMIGPTRILGDFSGPYIGTTGVLQKNVFLDIGRACKLNRSASAIVNGTLGGGKSFTADLLLYLQVIYGGKGLVIDPKGDRRNWDKELPELKNQVNIIELTCEEKDRGKLDPFLIYSDNANEAGFLALSILVDLFGISTNSNDYIVVMEAISYVKKLDKSMRCMDQVADRLLNFPADDEFAQDARRVGRKIKQLKEMALAALLFGKGGEQALSFEKRLNVILIQNLTMPDAKKPKEEYTLEETLSTVLMVPIASFARKFMHQDKKFFKCVLFDEAWALKSSSAGKQMMNSLIREGRALNAGCIFITQNVGDLDEEDIKANISYKFCFKATDKKEIKEVLNFLDLEETEENMRAIEYLKNGECIFKDLEGRVGKLKTDAVFNHLIQGAFNTNPEKETKYA